MTKMTKTKDAVGKAERSIAGERKSAKGAASRPRLTDSQLVALSAAAQRDDHVIVLPEGLEGKALSAFAAGLVRWGLAAEMPAKGSQPIWRRDDATGQDLTLLVSDSGLAAVGIEPASEAALQPIEDTAITRRCTTNETIVVSADATSVGALQPDTKQSRLVAMLMAERGCTIAEAAAAFGWLPHTTRAALTGLRRKGHVIERAKGEDGAASRHRIVATAAA